LQGAKDSELVIEACRRNNTDLLTEIIEKYTSVEDVARLLNEARTVLGNYAYHEAASRGNCAFPEQILPYSCDTEVALT